MGSYGDAGPNRIPKPGDSQHKPKLTADSWRLTASDLFPI